MEPPQAAPPGTVPQAGAPTRPAPAAPPTPAPAVPRPADDEVLPGLQRESSFQTRPQAPPASGASSARPSSPAKPPQPGQWVRDAERTIDFNSGGESKEKPLLETPPFQASPPAEPSRSAPPAAPAVQTQESETEATDEQKRTHERARRLARVLVSDILVYNQEARDRALREGSLVSALGEEVNKAWELYKSKVQPEVLEESNYFKDALNEILADGQKVF